MVGAPFNAASVKTTTPTSTGTADYTSSGFGTPKAALIYLTPATADDTDTAGLAFSWGVTDGVTDRAVAGNSEDGVGTSNAGGRGSRDHCVFLTNDATTVIVEAVFDSWITDGVRLNYTIVAGTAYKITVVLFGGDELQVATGDAIKPSGSSSSSVATEQENPDEDAPTPFEPDVVLSAGMPSTAEGWSPNLEAFFGISTNTPTAKNACCGILSEDNAVTSDTRRQFSNDTIAESYSWTAGTPSIVNDAYISAYTSGGFTLKSRTSPNVNASPRIVFLAMKLSADGTVPFDMDEDVLVPGSTGTQAATWPGHLSGFLYAVSSSNANVALQNSGACGVGSAVRNVESSFVIRDKRNVGTTENATYQSPNVLDSYNHNGGTHLFKGNVDSFDASGYTLNFTVINGTARRYSVLSIQLELVAGVGAGDLPLPVGDGVAVVRLSGSDGGGSLPLLTGFGSAAVRLSGSDGAGLMPLPTAAGVATFKAVTGAGAGTLPALDAAGSAAIRLSGSDGGGLLPLTTAAGVASLRLSASDGSGALPLLEAAGVVVLRLSGSDGSGLLPLPLAAGVATVTTSLVPGAVTRTCLAGSYARVSALSGSYVVAAALAGAYDRSTSLAGTYSRATALAGDYDRRTELAGDLETC